MKPAYILGLVSASLVCLLLWGIGTTSPTGGERAPLQSNFPGPRTNTSLAPVSVQGGDVETFTASQRSNGGADAGQDELPPLSGTVVLLDPRTGAVPTGTSVRFTGTEGNVVDSKIDASGEVTIPVGFWTIDPLVSGWTTAPSEIDLGPGAKLVVWMTRVRSVSIRVVSTSGEAVADARVEWWPSRDRTDPKGHRARTPATLAQTDREGSAHLADIGMGIGLLRVIAQGFLLRDTAILLDTGEELKVILTPAVGTGRELQFITSGESRGVPGVTLRTDRGSAVAEGDEEGRVILPEWVQSGAWLRLRAPGHVPAYLSVSQIAPDDTEVQWARATSVTFQSNEPANFYVRTEIVGEPSGPLIYETNGTPEQAEGGPDMKMMPKVIRHLPANSEVMYQAMDSIGRMAEGVVSTKAGRSTVDLDFKRPFSLKVTAIDPSGNPIANITALVRLPKTGLPIRIKADDEGRLHIPLFEGIYGFALFNRGDASTDVVAILDTPTKLQGALQVKLPQAEDLELVVMDMNGDPIAGLELSIYSRQVYEVMRLHPELGGGLPTEHPGWALEAPRSIIIQTDSDGRARIPALPLGRYEVQPQISSLLNPVLKSTSFYQPPLVIINHQAEIPQRLQVPRPTLVGIQVISEPGDLPVESVQLHCIRNPGIRNVPQPGSHWQGWIGADLGELRISAPDHIAATIHSEELARKRSIQVRLQSDQASVVQFTGDWNSLPNLKFVVLSRRSLSTEEGLKWIRSKVWQTEGTIQDGKALVNFPFTGEFEFAPIVGEEFVWLFEPRKFHWSPGVHPAIRVSTESVQLPPDSRDGFR